MATAPKDTRADPLVNRTRAVSESASIRSPITEDNGDGHDPTLLDQNRESLAQSRTLDYIAAENYLG